MSKFLPLLIFPKPKPIELKKGRSMPQSKIHFPDHKKQIERLTPQFEEIKKAFLIYKANITDTVTGLEPEMVLVIEIAGSVAKFHQAIEKAGLEWLGEWDIEEIEPDEDFYYKTDTEIKRTEKKLSRRLFVSLFNQRGLQELLSLWKKWKKEESLPVGKTKWRDVFKQTRQIRRWGVEETLVETGMIERWRDLTTPIQSDQSITFQIELFYRRNKEKRGQSEKAVINLLHAVNGKILSPFLDIQDIAFHAVKAELPTEKIQDLLMTLSENKISENNLNIQLFKFPGIMYFRPTGQAITSSKNDVTGKKLNFPSGKPKYPPIAAILDGVPNLKHKALSNRIQLDDPDNLSAEYQPGERRHGTSMASLIIHGDLSSEDSKPLSSAVYHLPVMQPNSKARIFDKFEEYFPDNVFFEDRIERAVRRIFEGDGAVSAQAPTVKVINLSIGDPDRPFIHTLSPFARLLDHLSFKYHVLFCVSAGNFRDKIDLNIPLNDFVKLKDKEKLLKSLKQIKKQLSSRRLLSPAESLNSLTVASLHTDESGDYNPGNRIDLLPNNKFFSPISRFGYGFRRSIKPEVLFPGGRQLYTSFPSSTDYSINEAVKQPGQKVAWDSRQAGISSEVIYTRGTSNATALATRSGVKIYEMLLNLQKENKNHPIPDNLVAVLIKTLLVHGAKQNNSTVEILTQVLNKSKNHSLKQMIARYIGYGSVDIDRVLNCTEQRGTVIGFGEIAGNKVHEYDFPLPISLSGQKMGRRMVVTLAWFSPINPTHRNLREAKLELKPSQNWGKTSLNLKRRDSNHNQVLRGTIQHEILEKNSQKINLFNEENGNISLQVICKADATEALEDKIPYGLAVTLEVEEGIDIPIYQEIRQKLKQPIRVKTP